ncbi:MAG: formate dehydrogenase accessory sulfurtransferase FdhD [Saprospiraceae bacterium]|nr:formate dehydrogenase accessory sulfurtransferase FdhD [Saprospiraceae bacterium]
MKEGHSVINVSILKSTGGQLVEVEDKVVAEDPLEIIIKHGRKGSRSSFPLAVTMRTHGEDHELALGFLFTENVIQKRSDVSSIQQLSADQILVQLNADIFFNEAEMHRNVYTSSSCGVCGKASIDRVTMAIPYVLKRTQPKVSTRCISQWPDVLRKRQSMFEKTGGIHAVGLFRQTNLLTLREDVGRHNAMDKLIGAALSDQTLPLDECAVLVSGRASFELVQKALMAGVPILAAVGAPSSLAIDLASAHNMTLIGFLRKEHFNIYCGAERILRH